MLRPTQYFASPGLFRIQTKRKFAAFEALSILLSWYPYKLRNACCIPAQGGCRMPLGPCAMSWATARTFFPPVGLVLVACVPSVRQEERRNGYGSKFNHQELDRRLWSMFPLSRASHFGYIFWAVDCEFGWPWAQRRGANILNL